SLSSPTNATMGVIATHTYTILDDDPLPSLSINNVAVTEGNTGTTNANFIVTLSPASSRTVTVNYATADGTATAPADYVAIPSTTLTFNPGETIKSITVPVNGDTVDETDETFAVNLSNPTNATLSTATGTGTIIDDDGPPTVTLSLSGSPMAEAGGVATVTAGHTGQTVNANFSVSLSAASPQSITVDYSTADGTATALADYIAKSGTVTFPANSTTPQTITIVVNGDNIDEIDETFTVNL